MSVARSAWTFRLLLVVAVLFVALLGNRRMESPDGLVEPVATRKPPTPKASVDGEQELELIPAIFARNSRVRFVYDRHVSKWM